MAAPAKPRTNVPAHTFPGTGTRAATGSRTRASASGPVSEFAGDPFIERMADPEKNERDRNSKRDIIEGLHQLEAQRARAAIADDFYQGDIGMVYASQQVRKLLAKQGVNEDDVQDFNYCKIPVDRIADRLQIAAVKVAPMVDEDDEDEATEPASTAKPSARNSAPGASGALVGKTAAVGANADPKVLRQAKRAVKLIRRNNRLDVYEKSLHKLVSLHGEAFLFLWPVQDDAGRVVSVDFRVNSAHDVTFVYDPEDPLRAAYVLKSWQTPSDFGEDGLQAEARKPVIRANLYYPGPLEIDAQGEITQGAGRVERWVTEPGAPGNLMDSWKRVHEAEDIADVDEVAADEFGDADDPLDDDDIPAPFGLTWFHFRNDVPRGCPEHEAAYGPQTLINKIVWSYAGVIEYQGFPQRYLLVDPKIDDPLMNDVNPDHPEDEDDDPENELGTSGLRADPGSVWRMYGRGTGQYSAADPDTFMKPLDRFIKSMAELTNQPLYAFTKNTADLPSGEAARELNAGQTSMIEDRQARYDPEWQDAYELALRMLGIDGIAVDVRWKPAAAVNDLNGLQVLKAKGELGVPSEVLLNEAGYPDDQVEAWKRSQAGQTLEQRIALLVQLATAITGISPGVTAGIVPDNTTSAFIARIIGNLAEGTHDTPGGPDALPAPTFRDPPPTLPPGGMPGAGGPGAGVRPGQTRATGTGKQRSAPAKKVAKKVAKKAVKAAAPAKATAAGSAQGGRM